MGAAAGELGGGGGDLGGEGVGAAAAELVGCGRARRRQSRTQARAGTALRGVGGKDVSRPSRLQLLERRVPANRGEDVRGGSSRSEAGEGDHGTAHFFFFLGVDVIMMSPSSLCVFQSLDEVWMDEMCCVIPPLSLLILVEITILQ